MANKNTLQRRRLSPVRTGQSAVISQNWDRNMELAIVGGKTVYRPIDPTRASWPKRQRSVNGNRRASDNHAYNVQPAVKPLNLAPVTSVQGGDGAENQKAA